MSAQEMVEDVKQMPYMSGIAACACAADVIQDHVANDIVAARTARQVFRKPAGYSLGNVLVLGDRENFFFGQAAEGNAILKTDHDEHSLHETRS
jgi:hypothetical protein